MGVCSSIRAVDREEVRSCDIGIVSTEAVSRGSASAEDALQSLCRSAAPMIEPPSMLRP